jgi:hypothetical protein
MFTAFALGSMSRAGPEEFGQRWHSFRGEGPTRNPTVAVTARSDSPLRKTPVREETRRNSTGFINVGLCRGLATNIICSCGDLLRVAGC